MRASSVSAYGRTRMQISLRPQLTSRFDDRAVIATSLNIAAAIRETKRRFEKEGLRAFSLMTFRSSGCRPYI